MIPRRPVLPWIQSLRGIAAFLVVLVHARFLLPGESGQFIAQTFLFPGALGVDLFFLVSGFIMMLTTSDCDGTPRYAAAFVAKRFARIWPLYICTSVIFGIFFTELRVFSDAHQFHRWVRSLTLLPVEPVLYFGMPVSVAWTLCFEVYFYAVLAVSMLFGRYRWLIASAWFVATLIAYPLYTGHFDLDPFNQLPIPSNRFANVVINPIIWDFILGALAGKLYLSPIRIDNAKYLQAVYLGMLLACTGAILNAVIGAPSPHGMTGWGAFLAPLFLLLVLLSKTREIRFPKVTAWLGDISYSLYLTHLIGFRASAAILRHFTFATPTKFAVCNFFGSIALGVVTGAVAYSVIEKPLSRWAQARLMSLLATRSNEDPATSVA
jgi:exopolysaccharide production protein ExoZ